MGYIEPDFKKYAQRQCEGWGSRFGEQGLVKYLTNAVEKTSNFTSKFPFLVEIGVHPCECNTIALIQKEDWDGIWIDAEPHGCEEDGHKRFEIQKEMITTENINPILVKNEVPWDFDLFSLDIDGNDYWVWKSMMFSPRIVILEYNAHFAVDESKVMRYDENHHWRGDRYYGASLLAFNKLAIEKGYTLVSAYCHNAIFVRNDCIDNPEDFKYEEVFQFFPVHSFSTPQSLPESEQVWIDV
jgi:hypothetical protein